MVVPQTWSGIVTFVWFVMCCWRSRRRYSVWTVHDDMPIFIAFIAPNVRAMSFDISWFLTLETAILFVWHHNNCGGWGDHCHELLWGIKFLHFWDGVSKCLRSLFKNPNSGNIICEIASLYFSFESVDVGCKGFFCHCWMSMKSEVYVWMLALHSLSLSKSFISSQDLSALIASMTNVWLNPLNLAFASLAWLSLVRSAAVSISINQSSNFVELYSLKTAMSCSKELVRFVCFCVVHNVLVYWCITSPKGSVGVGVEEGHGWSVREIL